MEQSSLDQAQGDAVAAATAPAATKEDLTASFLIKYPNVAASGVDTREQAKELIHAMENEDRTHLRVFLMGMITKATDRSVLLTLATNARLCKLFYRWIAAALREHETSSEFDEVFIRKVLEVLTHLPMEYEILQTYKLGKAVRAVRDAAAKEGNKQVEDKASSLMSIYTEKFAAKKNDKQAAESGNAQVPESTAQSAPAQSTGAIGNGQSTASKVAKQEPTPRSVAPVDSGWLSKLGSVQKEKAPIKSDSTTLRTLPFGTIKRNTKAAPGSTMTSNTNVDATSMKRTATSEANGSETNTTAQPPKKRVRFKEEQHLCQVLYYEPDPNEYNNMPPPSLQTVEEAQPYRQPQPFITKRPKYVDTQEARARAEYVRNNPKIVYNAASEIPLSPEEPPYEPMPFDRPIEIPTVDLTTLAPFVSHIGDAVLPHHSQMVPPPQESALPNNPPPTQPRAHALGKPLSKRARARAKKKQKRTPCFYYAEGRCMRDPCPFLHDANSDPS